MPCAFGTAPEGELPRRGGGRPADRRARPGGRGHHRGALRARVGPAAGGRLRLRGEGDDAAPPLRAWPPSRWCPPRRRPPTCWRPSPTASSSPTAPATPPPCPGPTAAVADLLGRVPVFGICLGHQLLCTALGGTTYKLPFGHHGSNHPVQQLSTGRVEVTSQNHNYAVRDVPGAEVTHVNLNDGVVEGMRHRGSRGLLGAVPPRGRARPPRRPLPLRRVRGADGRDQR